MVLDSKSYANKGTPSENMFSYESASNSRCVWVQLLQSATFLGVNCKTGRYWYTYLWKLPMSYKFTTFMDKLANLLIDLADLLQKYLGAIAIATDTPSESSWNLCGYYYNLPLNGLYWTSRCVAQKSIRKGPRDIGVLSCWKSQTTRIVFWPMVPWPVLFKCGQNQFVWTKLSQRK